MADIIVYSGPHCPYCVKAKQLLTMKGAKFTEVDVKSNPDKLDEMLQVSNGRRTIPQIVINGQHIGGCDDLYALNDKGGLDPLLAQ